MRRGILVGLLTAGTLGLAACGSQSTTASGAASASQCTPASSGITQTATTSAYKMVLDVGPQETMYTRAQVQAQHPTGGEVMLRGQMVMAGMGPSKDPAAARHLEVHICNLKTGQVVTDLSPKITLVDNTANNMTDDVPSAVMQGTTSSAADIHYGNNVTMPPGRQFTVTVAVSAQTATFHVSTPPSS